MHTRTRTHTVAAALKRRKLNPNTDTLRDSGCWINDADCFPHGWGLAADSLRGQSLIQFSNVRKKKKNHILPVPLCLSHTQTLQWAPTANRACVSLNSCLRCQTQLKHFQPEGELRSRGLRWTVFNETFKVRRDEGWEEVHASGGGSTRSSQASVGYEWPASWRPLFVLD